LQKIKSLALFNMQYSIVNYSEIIKNDFRLDAEYYVCNILNNKNIYKNLGDLAQIKGGKRLPLDENFSENGVPYIRAEDINNFVDYSKSPKISIELHNKLKNYQTNFNDVLLTIVGNSIGDVGIIKFNLDKCNLTENSAKVNHCKEINPDYLFTFLKCKFGQMQITREVVGTAQPKLALCRIAKLQIPILSTKFQNQIASRVQKAFELKQSSQILYKEAENLLLQELGLLNWQPKHQLWCVKNHSQTLQANRLDAEYFQPKYEELLEKIRRYKGGFMELGQIGKFISGSFVSDEFYSETGIPYIRIKELSFKGSINKEQTIYLNENFKRKNETQVFEGDFVVATIGNTIGKVNLIDKELSGAIPSNNTSKYELNNKEDSFYFQILLQSFIFQKQIEREYTQTAQPKISDSGLSKIIIPILPFETQQQISQKVIESKENDKQSKSLLETAKKAVEIAIEQNEEVAMSFIDDNK